MILSCYLVTAQLPEEAYCSIPLYLLFFPPIPFWGLERAIHLLLPLFWAPRLPVCPANCNERCKGDLDSVRVSRTSWKDPNHHPFSLGLQAEYLGWKTANPKQLWPNQLPQDCIWPYLQASWWLWEFMPFCLLHWTIVPKLPSVLCPTWAHEPWDSHQLSQSPAERPTAQTLRYPTGLASYG